MSKAWTWGGGTLCNVQFENGGYLAVLSGEAVLLVRRGRAMYVGFGHDPKDTRLFRGEFSYAPTHTGVILPSEVEVDHVLTHQEFALVVEVWEWARENIALPARCADHEHVKEGLTVGDRVIQTAREYFYHK